MKHEDRHTFSLFLAMGSRQNSLTAETNDLTLRPVVPTIGGLDLNQIIRLGNGGEQGNRAYSAAKCSIVECSFSMNANSFVKLFAHKE